MDLMDDIYSLAYWMTGSEASATELVNITYLNVTLDTPESEVYKTFRECYFDTFGYEEAPCIPKPSCNPMEKMGSVLLQRDADIKLSVLLSAVSGLKHGAISKIIGKPLDTIREWLSVGRKSLAERVLTYDASLLHGISIDKDPL
ncbi:RNA polymerase sigma24 factor [Pelodictyon phaeoclathratiforme]|jgi:DNA-directed RNA polymerase specialized sigma24 family protein|uniref:RNA polymerase, sigma-24 subunit, ECF subfamily n=1 Tax=Pelodictyon phaeoclathratiforme (strain DSM 5477 / BU-1) TaxID=324925 RepID=B4SB50_PELPB|nr:RNA polymerase, sigma-24 subunit, ECF subfamily [Pelodictyon phaeoclathratiforme BU-1]